MAKNLAKLLDQPEAFVTKAVERLESANGYPSHDVRLLAENSQAVRLKLSDLGLDPDDTTGEELHQALLAKFSRDCGLLDKALGIDAKTGFAVRAQRAISLIKASSQTGDMWTLKHSKAKQLLRELPPKKTMKLLNYRSLDSLLKRENITSIYLAVAYNESASWQKSLAKHLAKLGSLDYELRPPQFACLTSPGYAKLTSPGSMVGSSRPVGAVGLWPTAKIQTASVLTLALLFLDGLEGLTHAPVNLSLGRLNPALGWWEQAKSLVANLDGDIVSLNFEDLAFSQLGGNNYVQRVSHHAQHSLWNNLASRYKNQSSQLEAAWGNLENGAAEGINDLSIASVLPARLAAEYSEV